MMLHQYLILDFSQYHFYSLPIKRNYNTTSQNNLPFCSLFCTRSIFPFFYIVFWNQTGKVFSKNIKNPFYQIKLCAMYNSICNALQNSACFCSNVHLYYTSKVIINIVLIVRIRWFKVGFRYLINVIYRFIPIISNLNILAYF